MNATIERVLFSNPDLGVTCLDFLLPFASRLRGDLTGHAVIYEKDEEQMCHDVIVQKEKQSSQAIAVLVVAMKPIHLLRHIQVSFGLIQSGLYPIEPTSCLGATVASSLSQMGLGLNQDPLLIMVKPKKSNGIPVLNIACLRPETLPFFLNIDIVDKVYPFQLQIASFSFSAEVEIEPRNRIRLCILADQAVEMRTVSAHKS